MKGNTVNIILHRNTYINYVARRVSTIELAYLSMCTKLTMDSIMEQHVNAFAYYFLQSFDVILVLFSFS